MDCCAKCGHSSITKAHVKDKDTCIKEGNSNHENLNIIELCYNCHYLLFDTGKMGIRNIQNEFYFIWINDHNEIEESKSLTDLNVLEDNIRWKNMKCKPKLIRRLFKK